MLVCSRALVAWSFEGGFEVLFSAMLVFPGGFFVLFLAELVFAFRRENDCLMNTVAGELPEGNVLQSKQKNTRRPTESFQGL
jgi:hypothetical protein